MRLLLGLLVLWASPLFAADDRAPESPDAPPMIYECTDADGQTVYQDDPCVDVAPPVAKPTKTPKPANTPKPKKTPQPQATSKPAKATKPPAMTKPEPASIPWVARPTKLPARRFDVPPASGPIDARMATPEETLRTFVSAVRAGDGTLVVSCLTSEALAGLGPEPEELPLEQLKETVKSFTGFVPEGDLGPYWSIRALRAGTRPKWILFERTGSGEWKIGWI